MTILAFQFDPQLFSGEKSEAEIVAKVAAEVMDSTPRRMADQTIAWLSRIHEELLGTGRRYRTLKVERIAANRGLRRTAAKTRTAVAGVRDHVFSVYGPEFEVSRVPCTGGSAVAAAVPDGIYRRRGGGQLRRLDSLGRSVKDGHRLLHRPAHGRSGRPKRQ